MREEDENYGEIWKINGKYLERIWKIYMYDMKIHELWWGTMEKILNS